MPVEWSSVLICCDIQQKYVKVVFEAALAHMAILLSSWLGH